MYYDKIVLLGYMQARSNKVAVGWKWNTRMIGHGRPFCLGEI
jgi:hypothetical protein